VIVVTDHKPNNGEGAEEMEITNSNKQPKTRKQVQVRTNEESNQKKNEGDKEEAVGRMGIKRKLKMVDSE
jgi:hypothetical protein